MHNYKTCIIRLYPNNKQQQFINQNIILCKEMYNIILNAEYDLYNNYLNLKKEYNLSKDVAQELFFKSAKRPIISKLKKKDEKFKLADSLSLEYEQKNVKIAFQKAFLSNSSRPKFKKLRNYNSYTTRNVNNNIKLTSNYIVLPKLGKIKVRGVNHQYLDYKITVATVRDARNTKYYVHLHFKEETSSIQNAIPISSDYSNITGLDFKVGSIFTSSENFTPDYFSVYYKLLNHLKELEIALKQKEYHSNSWYKIMNKIRNVHKKIASYRKDFQHKLSTKMCEEFDYIIIESLNLKDIAQKLHSGVNTYDTSYGLFTSKLNYKVNSSLIKINKWFPSSKTCSKCGNIKKKLPLSQRIYKCRYCNNEMDRDLNAAINIKNEGIRLLKDLKNKS